MFQRNSANKRKKRKKSYIIFYNIFRLIIAISIPILYKIYLSLYFKNLKNIPFQLNSLNEYIPYLKEVYLVLFNKYHFQLAIPLLLVYNYCNIYKTFILLISLIYPLCISTILNLYLINNINDKKEINEELLYTTGYLLILWEILFNSEKDEKLQFSVKSLDSLKKGTSRNNFSLFLIIIFILSLLFTNYLLFNNIDNIIFDSILGLTSYYILFKIFELNPNYPRQFHKFIELNFSYFFVIIFIVNVFLIIFIININNNNPDKEEIIKYIIYKYSFSTIIIGIYLGAKYEYNFYFDKRFNNWAQYNFEFDGEIAEEEESLASSISFNKARQWNHTGFCISLIRLLFIFLLSFGCLYLCLNINLENFFYELFLIYVIPWNIFSFGLFHLFKLILKYLKVTNILLLTIIGERESF